MVNVGREDVAVEWRLGEQHVWVYLARPAGVLFAQVARELGLGRFLADLGPVPVLLVVIIRDSPSYTIERG